ncbi:MAG TPA: hypothetical protein VGK10_00885 [Prolixibacteraceae bacterium]
MKAIQSIKQILPVVIFSVAIMSASLEVNAQNSRNNNKFDRNRDRKEYRNDHSKSADYSYGKNESRNGDNKHFKGHNQGRNDRDYEYGQQYSNRGEHSQQNYFNHPKYGRVYQRFDEKPVVFRHSHGDYYYSGNQFYRYRDGVGYCAEDAPRMVYFRDLPFSCNRVHVNNQLYFRHGDLYFSHSPRGYVIVPSPIEVNFSVRF